MTPEERRALSTELAGLGRGELLEKIHALTESNARIRNERDAYLENLTHVQERCTELLLEVRFHRREREEALTRVETHRPEPEAFAEIKA